MTSVTQQVKNDQWDSAYQQVVDQTPPQFCLRVWQPYRARITDRVVQVRQIPKDHIVEIVWTS